jgi:predicted dehydrogenase
LRTEWTESGDIRLPQWRVAIAGTGGIAHRHVEAIRQQKQRSHLVAAVGRDAEKTRIFAEARGIPEFYTDLGAMLSKVSPDLVLLCTPPAAHFAQVIACLQANAWVLCEKPICGSLAELSDLAAAEQVSRARCASVFQWRFGAPVLYLKRLMDRGVLGRALLATCATTWYRAPTYYESSWKGNWRTALGGATLNQGIHQIDLLLSLFGEWHEVMAMAATVDHEIEVDDVSIALVHFQSGAIATITNSVVSPREETRMRLDFQRATVELNALYQDAPEFWSYFPRGDSSNSSGAWTTDDLKGPLGHAAQLALMFDAMDGLASVPVSINEIRPTLDIVSSMYKSSVLRTPVQSGSIIPGDPFYDHVAGVLGANASSKRASAP